MAVFLGGVLVCAVLSVGWYCFQKIDREGAKRRVIILIITGAVLSLLSLIPAGIDGMSGDNMAATMFMVLFVYIVCFGWRIVMDIVRICRDKNSDVHDKRETSTRTGGNESGRIAQNDEREEHDSDGQATRAEKNAEQDLRRKRNMFENVGFEMNEEVFAKCQGDNPWFMPAFLCDLPPLDLSLKNGEQRSLTVTETQQCIFGKIFGTSGFHIDLGGAVGMCESMLKYIEKDPPVGAPVRTNEEFMNWLRTKAEFHVQLGTAYAYKKEYVRAAYHLLMGLKATAANFSGFYCDFIRYVLAKFENVDAPTASYRGCGFSNENYMGCVSDHNGVVMLDASIATDVIPSMNGKNGEVLVCWKGQSRFYGVLNRRGSTNAANSRLILDMYDTLLIDRNYNLSKIRFYFNGYRSINPAQKILLADGFVVPRYSIVGEKYRFVSNN